MKRFVLALAVLMGCCLAVSAQEYVPAPVTVSKEKVKLNGKVYLSHVVLEKQTIYGITRAYGITEDELYEANPSLKETGLQKNAIILIPYKEGLTGVEGGSQDYTEHTVRWYEDIDEIAKRYNVTVKDIMEANNLKSKKLSTRQVLKIPIPKREPEPESGEQAASEEQPLAPVVTEEAPPEASAAEENHEPQEEMLTIKGKEQVEFSLVLPLTSGTGNNENNMDFYSGVLMALKDLEAEGLKVKVNVFDLHAGLPQMDMLLGSDFILGPVAARDLEAILQRVDGRVPVISPLDQKAASLTHYYTNFIQVPPAVDNQYDDLAEWVKDEMQEDDKLILITEKGAVSISAAVSIRSALAKRELQYEILSYGIVEGRGIPATLTELMSDKHTNRVVVASESEAFVGDAVRNIGIMLGKGYDVVMYAPSKVRTFDTIEGSAYHDASLHLCTTYHADYSHEPVEAFVLGYRALFNTEPSQFAFQGYDTARFFARQAATYGNSWVKYLGASARVTGLHTDFLFTTDQYGNPANRAVRRIVFKKDYTTSLER